MEFFDRAYEGSPPWDIGRPQSAVVRLEESGAIVGRVLDVGCGTGENAIFLAGRGHEVLGVDFAPNAVRRAKEKATGRRVRGVEFREVNALHLDCLGTAFDTAVDCGLFHALSDAERPVYVASLHSILRRGGRLVLLCFSELEPADWGGPRRVRQDELRAAFSGGWTVESIAPARFDVALPSIEGRAWLAQFRRR